MTNIDALIVTVDGSAVIESIDPGWQTLNKRIGGYIEAVGGQLGEWLAYGDEEGRLKGLPENALATGLLQAMRSAPVIPVGTIIFVGQRYVGGEDGYEDADIPSELRGLVFPAGE